MENNVEKFVKKNQEKINEELWKICLELKSIPNLNASYLEYMSALLYIIYTENLKYEGNNEELHRFINELDKKLDFIREEVTHSKIFINIRFKNIIENREERLLERIIINLFELKKYIEHEIGTSKEIMANAYEYIILQIAKRNDIRWDIGEFYTPKGIVKTMVGVLSITDGSKIYNPFSSSGNFLVESLKKNKAYIYGEEENISRYNICMTNLFLHAISSENMKIKQYEKNKKFDVILANPPFSTLENYNDNEQAYLKGYQPYIKMALDQVNEHGKICFILPHGFLFKETEKNLREYLIRNNFIDCIVGLPPKLFYGTKIPVIILVLNKSRKTEGILFIDASKEYTKKRQNNILTVENQNKIIDTYKQYKEIKNYSYVASVDEIESNDWNLNIRKYIREEEKREKIDVNELSYQIRSLEKEREKIGEEINEILKSL